MARLEVPMYARVWRLGILPGKTGEFAAAVNSGIPILRRQAGFHSLLVLRGGPGEKLEATIVSAWDSLEALRNSENSAFQEGLDRVLSYCEHHPFMREEEVLVSEFAARDLSDATAGP
jgi:heme-degrading monooxygenase HmoA